MKPKSKKTKQKKKNKPVLRRKAYNPDNLNEALRAVKEGMSKKLASKTYHVPRATLQYRIKYPEHQARPGPPTILSETEEQKLENWLVLSSRKGFPKRKEDLIRSVSIFLKKNNRASVFKKGEKWYKLFLQRHPNISVRTPEAVTAASAAVSEDDVKGWFKQIEDYLKENNVFELLEDPSRVFNGDETNFLLCPKTGVVLAPKGERNVYEVDSAQAKTSLTVMFTFCANGDLTPPMVIFPNKRLSADITSKIPSEWGIGLSDNGWMKAEIFHDYIESVLHPHLVRKGTQFPIILFVDGHKTHLTYEVSELCIKLDIILIALYPNCTRLLQPADVSAFKPLKSGWQKTVLEWRRNHPSEALTKSSFVPLLNKTIKNTITPSTVINGFRATGLCPWNVNAVDFSKCLGKSKSLRSENMEETNEEEGRVLTKEDFKNIIGTRKISQIERGEPGPAEDLKKIWDFFTKGTTCVTSNENDINMTLGGNDAMDIENMPVIIDGDLNEDMYECLVPALGTEVVVNTSVSEEHNYNGRFQEHGTLDLPGNSEVIHITHKAEVYTAITDSTGKSIDPQKVERPRNSVPCQQNSDLDQIEIYSEPDADLPKKPSNLLNLTPVKLTDVLVLPKTPQRKGVKNIKRDPFVLTSDKWRSIENEKIRIKQEKENEKQKRKEEREKKKLEREKKKLEREKNKQEREKNKQEVKTKQTKPKAATETKNKKEKIETVNKDKTKEIEPKVATKNKKKKESETVSKYAITMKSPVNENSNPIDNFDEKENCSEDANVAIDSNKILYTDAEIEKFLTELED